MTTDGKCPKSKQKQKTKLKLTDNQSDPWTQKFNICDEFFRVKIDF